jgi:hypothetical protein
MRNLGERCCSLCPVLQIALIHAFMKSKQVLRTVMQMVRLHLNEGRDSSALMSVPSKGAVAFHHSDKTCRFHASTCDHLLPSSRVNTVQLAKRLSSPSVFLSSVAFTADIPYVLMHFVIGHAQDQLSKCAIFRLLYPSMTSFPCE